MDVGQQDCESPARNYRAHPHHRAAAKAASFVSEGFIIGQDTADTARVGSRVRHSTGSSLMRLSTIEYPLTEASELIETSK